MREAENGKWMRKRHVRSTREGGDKNLTCMSVTDFVMDKLGKFHLYYIEREKLFQLPKLNVIII